MATNTTTFNGVTWDSQDLVSSKNAVRVLSVNGTPDDVILDLENMGLFGNLNVSAVLDELYSDPF